ncbi:MAG: hypothetical protein M2R45_05399 [Verrucomicrobia subdivision 3 bacterium]|nr:hypothetical protein [Limisphaerales bacterium]MCS1412648.1 hypothetical protein [Limisphaerales bacterium]
MILRLRLKCLSMLRCGGARRRRAVIAKIETWHERVLVANHATQRSSSLRGSNERLSPHCIWAHQVRSYTPLGHGLWFLLRAVIPG